MIKLRTKAQHNFDPLFLFSCVGAKNYSDVKNEQKIDAVIGKKIKNGKRLHQKQIQTRQEKKSYRSLSKGYLLSFYSLDKPSIFFQPGIVSFT